MAKRSADLTNMRFGRWLVVREAERTPKSRRWLCRCDCGTEKIVFNGHLLSGNSTSCGCRKLEQRHDLTGRRVGRLVVESPAPKSHDGRTRWTCRCDCGGELTTYTSHLNASRVESCGCIRKDNARARIGVPLNIGTPSYHTAHKRVAAIRGRASTHACVDCGGPAREWSYDHADPHETTGPDSRGRILTYSTDPTHYQPRCTTCHHAFDGVNAH